MSDSDKNFYEALDTLYTHLDTEYQDTFFHTLLEAPQQKNTIKRWARDHSE